MSCISIKKTFVAVTAVALLYAVGGAFAQMPEKSPDNAQKERLAERFFEAVYDRAWSSVRNDFPVADSFRETLWSDEAQKWPDEFRELGGVRGERIKTEVSYQEGYQNFYLYYTGSRVPIRACVSFDGNKIAGVSIEHWKDGPSPPLTQMIFYYLCALPVLAFFVIYLGERFRAWRIRRRLLRTGMAYDLPPPGVKYREKQKPLWMYLLVLLLGSPFLMFPYEPTLGYRYADFIWMGFIVVVLLALPFLGFSLVVKDKFLTVGMGFFRVPVLTIPLLAVTDVAVVPFRPFREFGGFGIRRNRDKTRGYFMSGTLGVQIETHDGQKYLLGSDTPERMAEVIISRIKLLRAGRP